MRDESGFDQSLEIDGKIVRLAAEFAAGGTPRTRIAPVEHDDAVHYSIAFQQWHPLFLHHPGKPRAGERVAEGCDCRERVDDVPHRPQTHDQNAGNVRSQTPSLPVMRPPARSLREPPAARERGATSRCLPASR